MIRGHIAAMIVGFLLDLCFGDPHWLPHPVRAMGWLITHVEKGLRLLCPKEARGERIAGLFLVLMVLGVTGGTASGCLWLAGRLHPYAFFALESILCYQMLATKSLKDESMKVYDAFRSGDTEAARRAVSMIVGRDTKPLSERGILSATVETVAENTSDGVIAPLFYMALGGGVWGALYKAVNTMDSMIGYKNETYQNFGRAAARLDDLVNFIPSRLSAFLMIAAAFLLNMDAGNALRIYRRDRRQHQSPNSAQTESVC
ncbi:MAG: adenosylcobinamide-phosphate synthase CbiB, partial [Hungatella sp.]